MNNTSSQLKNAARKASALLGPINFSVAGGHFRSALGSRPVDAFGHPLPWYTYPCVDFLRVLDLSQRRVAEFGSGNSTLWWAAHCKEVLALESNPEWYEIIREQTDGLPNAHLELVASPEDAAELIQADYYDIIVVDDGSGAGPAGRPVNVESAFRRVKKTGLVIVDNADTSYSSNGHYPIIECANQGRWLRVDFVGHAPGSMKRSCSSLFFRPEVEILSNLGPPALRQWRSAD